MGRWIWFFYRRYFVAKGYRVYLFGYPTTGQPFEKSIMQLTAFVNSRAEDVVHVVAHSMGGVLSVRSMAGFNKSGKLMLLGAPINGSQVARKLKQRGWHKWLLRHATAPLIAGAKNPAINRPTYMLAGIRPYGLGRLLHRIQPPHDGTVGLEETQVEWLGGHQTLATTHTGLLTSQQARSITADFLSQ